MKFEEKNKIIEIVQCKSCGSVLNKPICKYCGTESKYIFITQTEYRKIIKKTLTANAPLIEKASTCMGKISTYMGKEIKIYSELK